MRLPRASVRPPTGLSFDVADLVMLRGWSEYHDLRMTIELDACADGDEYEELLALYDRDCAFRRWMIWRSGDGIVVAWERSDNNDRRLVQSGSDRPS